MPLLVLKMTYLGDSNKFDCELSGFPKEFLSHLKKLKPQIQIQGEYKFLQVDSKAAEACPNAETYCTVAWGELSTDYMAPTANIISVLNLIDSLNYELKSSTSYAYEVTSRSNQLVLWTFQKPSFP